VGYDQDRRAMPERQEAGKLLTYPWMPWIVARRLFGPISDNGEATTIDFVSRFRTMFGFAFVCELSDKYGVSDQFVIDASTAAEMTLFVSLGAALILGCIAVCVNRDTSPMGAMPIIRAIAGICTVAVYTPISKYGYLDKLGVYPQHMFFDIISIWYMPFLVTAVFHWIWYPIGLSERDPAISPLVTCISVTVVTGTSLILGYNGGIPFDYWLAVTLVGATTSLVLAIWELHRIRSMINGVFETPSFSESVELVTDLRSITDLEHAIASSRIIRTPPHVITPDDPDADLHYREHDIISRVAKYAFATLINPTRHNLDRWHQFHSGPARGQWRPCRHMADRIAQFHKGAWKPVERRRFILDRRPEIRGKPAQFSAWALWVFPSTDIWQSSNSGNFYVDRAIVLQLANDVLKRRGMTMPTISYLNYGLVDSGADWSNRR
jgi:hypothetical protein